MGTATRYDIIFGTRWDAFQLYRDDPLMLVNEAQLGESWRSVEELVEYCDRVEIRRMGDIYAVPKIGMYPWQARQSLTFKSLEYPQKRSDIEKWVETGEGLVDFLLSYDGVDKDRYATLACDLAEATAKLRLRFPPVRKSVLG